MNLVAEKVETLAVLFDIELVAVLMNARSCLVLHAGGQSFVNGRSR